MTGLLLRRIPISMLGDQLAVVRKFQQVQPDWNQVGGGAQQIIVGGGGTNVQVIQGR